MQHRVVHSDTRNLTPEHSACKTGFCKRLIDKKPLFARHRPARAEIMPETAWISDVMGESMADAGIKVNRPLERALAGVHPHAAHVGYVVAQHREQVGIVAC